MPSSVHWLHGNGGLSKSHTIHSSGVDITATATAYDAAEKDTYSAHVGQYSGGLGVTNSVYQKRNWRGQIKTYSNDGSHTVDGKGYDDTLWLNFSKEFNVHGALFTHVGKKFEDVEIVDGNGGVLGRFGLSGVANHNGYAYLDLKGLDYSGSKIGFTAFGDYDSWKVKAVKGHAVPTPSAAAAGLLGLAALTARRRRQATEEVVEQG